ncbi:serine phosphatase RsbU (regulator of sigma subunit) [Kitasatospora sp. MAA19]|uniref:SpoIIE family protein phosphatase n=1 Tax=Kitasatospora sp. MAA19 TaxID=3035090 RepID=UPI002475DBF6|nr:SpoIIE family protein phosphatase [Kitasatospora sp. MAA19]MDH6706602.1 serine phosphatase RsbU (regulator of sigma subunit) [Kitasatospora sp. MAA19]
MQFRHGNRAEDAPPATPAPRPLAAAAAHAASLGSLPEDKSDTDRDGNSPDLLRDLLATAPVGVALLDDQLRWQYLNTAFAAATGLRRADLLGRPAEATPFAGAAPTLRRVLADGHDREHATGGPEGPGSPVPPGLRVRYRPLEHAGRTTGVIVVVLDDPAPARGRLHELEQARARLALLDAAAERIGTTLDLSTTCAELTAFTVPGFADLATIDVLPPDADPARPGHGAPLRLQRAAVDAVPALRAALGESIRPGESVRHGEGSAAARSLAGGGAVLTEPGPEDASPVGITSLLVLPLATHDRLVGLLTLGRSAATPAFTPDEAALLGALAARAAAAIDHARRYTRSQGIALELQRALLTEPGNPHQNLLLASRYLPSGTSSVVGGDWYETVRLPFGRTLLAMGDVMGHGVEAAVDMSHYRSTLRDVAGMDLPPHRILRQLDNVISANDTARPATCLLVLADPGRGRWTLSSAGHLPPALITPDHATELLQVPTGPPLGTGLGGYEQTTHPLTPDQTLLLYTDGLVERRDEDIDASLARLAALRLPATGDLDDLLDAVLHALAPPGPTTHGTTTDDDIALLAARPKPR